MDAIRETLGQRVHELEAHPIMAAVLANEEEREGNSAMCLDWHGGYKCTRETLHHGYHVAGVHDGPPVAVWV